MLGCDEPSGGAGAAALGGAGGGVAGGSVAGGGGLVAEGGAGGAPTIDETTGGSTALGGSAQGGSAQGGSQTVLPPLCTRLVNSTSLSTRVSMAYRDAVSFDCRVAALIYELSAAEQPLFAQSLFEFNLALWGCSGAPPVEYTLAYGATHLTSTDAEQLTLHYLDACSSYLQLGDLELRELRSQLDRLSEGAIVERTNSYSLSVCDSLGASGAGGGGGAAGGGP